MRRADLRTTSRPLRVHLTVERRRGLRADARRRHEDAREAARRAKAEWHAATDALFGELVPLVLLVVGIIGFVMAVWP